MHIFRGWRPVLSFAPTYAAVIERQEDAEGSTSVIHLTPSPIQLTTVSVEPSGGEHSHPIFTLTVSIHPSPSSAEPAESTQLPEDGTKETGETDQGVPHSKGLVAGGIAAAVAVFLAAVISWLYFARRSAIRRRSEKRQDAWRRFDRKRISANISTSSSPRHQLSSDYKQSIRSPTEDKVFIDPDRGQIHMVPLHPNSER